MVMQRSMFVLFLGLLLTLVPGCGGGEEENLGATASLAWDPVNHSTPVTYTVHYGRQPTEDFGSCNYEHSLEVSEPFATITGLEFDTMYYFAVSANSGARGSCSNEVSKATERPRQHTPPVKEDPHPHRHPDKQISHSGK
jgi:hypothetical protein